MRPPRSALPTAVDDEISRAILGTDVLNAGPNILAVEAQSVVLAPTPVRNHAIVRNVASTHIAVRHGRAEVSHFNYNSY